MFLLLFLLTQDVALVRSDHNLTVTKSKCEWDRYTSYEKIKLTSSSTIFKTVYHNVSYLMLFGKRKSQNFEILGE